MQSRFQFFLLTALLIVLCSCTNAVPGNSAIEGATIGITPSPVASDKATVVGKVVSTISNQPLSINVSLAKVVRQDGKAVMALDVARSPSTTTQKDGSFVLSNIDAQEYVVVVGDIYTKYVIISEAPDQAKVYDAKAGVVTNLGELRVDI